MNVLIADDNEINRQFLLAVLGDPEYRISEASNGHEAIALCREQQFELIFMDIRMPEMDGIEAVRRIRQLVDHDPTHTCIIALTADLQLQLQDQLLADGFNACLTKPISRVQLLDTVQRVQNGLCLEAKTQREGGQDGQPVDLDQALAATGGNRELLDKLTQMFAIELQQMLPIIRSGINAGDFDPARECAHKLRASAGYCGAIEVRQAAAAVETAAIARDAARAGAAEKHLQRASERLQAFIRSD